MKIRLQSLTLRNFKGIEHMVVDFPGNTNILGANESGKSTLCTAFMWLLTGKDEFDRKDYEIKNTVNTELNSQPHEVEGVFLVDNRELKLRRVYLEKWIKPRGKAEKEFTGHEVEYYQNDIPCSAKEYQEKVDGIIPANVIKLITNPTYFNTLAWQDQRRGLVAIAGNITDDEVLKAIITPENQYTDLIVALNDPKYKSLDEYRKHIQTKKKLLKEAAEKFEPRIQEVLHNIPEAKDWMSIEADITIRKIEIKNIDDQVSNAQVALKAKQDDIVSLQKEVFAAQQKVDTIRGKIYADLQAKQGNSDGEIAAVKSKIKLVTDNIASLQNELLVKGNKILANQTEISLLEQAIAGCRTKWDELNERVFEFDESSCVCPTCRQSLPADEIEANKEALRVNFMQEVLEGKSEQVEKSNARKNEKANIEALITSLNESINSIKEQISEEQSVLAAHRETFSALQEEAGKKASFDINVAVEALLQKNGDALNLQDEVAKLNADILERTAALNDELDHTKIKATRKRLQDEIESLSTQMGERATIEKMNLRIEHLQEEEKSNGQEIAHLERQEFEVESFIRAKMDILEERVNQLFQHVSFRLFEKQVNGGIAETCVCEYKGVPYPTLNTAAKMLAGLDVIETFSRHYNIYAPVFCDNRESVSYVPEIQSQVISLFVSPQDKALRIEAA